MNYSGYNITKFRLLREYCREVISAVSIISEERIIQVVSYLPGVPLDERTIKKALDSLAREQSVKRRVLKCEYTYWASNHKHREIFWGTWEYMCAQVIGKPINRGAEMVVTNEEQGPSVDDIRLWMNAFGIEHAKKRVQDLE
jgi:hypothetical protein